jgi:hypothetical protein
MRWPGFRVSGALRPHADCSVSVAVLVAEKDASREIDCLQILDIHA